MLRLAVIALLLTVSAKATTITASALTPAAVQAAIDSALDGDTVILPGGSATWATSVTFTNKALTITGAGQGVTVLTATKANGELLSIHSLGTKTASVSAMTMIGNTGGACINIGGNSEINTNVRIHHITFTVNKRGISIQGRNDGGLIDHCVFNCTLNAACQGITVYGDAGYYLVPGNTAASFPANTAWTKTAIFGDSARVFIEDNDFNFDYTNDAAIEGYQGAIVCIRHNNFKETLVGMHGLDSSISGSHSYEIYSNTFTSNYYLSEGPGGIGSNGDFIVGLRSGTGVIHDNAFTVAWAGSHTFLKRIGLQCYRAIGDNLSYNFALRGSHNGASNSVILSKSSGTWTTNQFVNAHGPYTLWNRTDGSLGKVTANTATTITATLTGGTDNDWDSGDNFSLAAQEGGMLTGINVYDGNTAVTNGSGTHTGSNNSAGLTDASKSWTVNQFVSPIQHTVWNRTDGSYGRITANTATTITARMIGGADNDFDAGDSYVITFGYPGLEQVGSTGPVTLNGTYSTETLSPLYQWNNILNGSTSPSSTTGLFVCTVDPGSDAILAAQGQVRPYPSDIVVANRDYFDNVTKPGYTAYTYPHPLQGGASPTPTPTPPPSVIPVAPMQLRSIFQ